MNKLPEAVEDICMIGKSEIMDIASDFIFYKECDADRMHIDWQTRYAEYMKINNIEVKGWLNNELYIYRDSHRKAGISPRIIASNI